MAKGFTVKASKPKKSKKEKIEWDYENIKERWRGKKIVFCLPGRGVSYVFLKTLCNLHLTWCRTR